MHNLLTPETYNTGTNEDGTSELEQLFGKSVFDNPKPTSLIKTIIKAISNNNNCFTVLDFFSGSATTAHAVMQLNAKDGGNRKFIMVQLPENAIQNQKLPSLAIPTLPKYPKNAFAAQENPSRRKNP